MAVDDPPHPEPRSADEVATWRGVSTLLTVVSVLALGYAMVASRRPSTHPMPATPKPPSVPARAPPPAAAPAPMGPSPPSPVNAATRDVPAESPPTVTTAGQGAPDAAAPPTVTAAGQVRTGDCSGANDWIAWGCRATVAGLSCTRVFRAASGVEPEVSNYFCSVPGVEPRWLDARPGAGSECMQVMVPRARNAWTGAFLCVATTGPLLLRSSFARPIDGADCIEGWEPWAARRSTHNHLCWSLRPRPVEPHDAGNG